VAAQSNHKVDRSNHDRSGRGGRTEGAAGLLGRRGALSAEQFVRAFIEPGLDLADHHGGQGSAVARFLGRVLFDPSPRIRQVFVDPQTQLGPVG
jgi:hypothetical protein